MSDDVQVPAQPSSPEGGDDRDLSVRDELVLDHVVRQCSC
jgi:hypothetical protein